MWLSAFSSRSSNTGRVFGLTNTCIWKSLKLLRKSMYYRRYLCSSASYVWILRLTSFRPVSLGRPSVKHLKVKRVAPLHSQEVSGSGEPVTLTDGFAVFISISNKFRGSNQKLGHAPSFPTTLQNHSSLILLPFGTVYSEILITLLNCYK